MAVFHEGFEEFELAPTLTQRYPHIAKAINDIFGDDSAYDARVYGAAFYIDDIPSYPALFFQFKPGTTISMPEDEAEKLNAFLGDENLSQKLTALIATGLPAKIISGEKITFTDIAKLAAMF